MHAPFAVLCLAVMTGCSTIDAPQLTEPDGASPSERLQVELGEPFTLAPGQVAENAALDLAVRFVEVVRDSRCPDEVDCVWEGDAELVVATVEKGDERTHRLHTHGPPVCPTTGVLASGHVLELIDLKPGTRADRSIPQEEYRATFRLVPAVR